jgi:hypothetical protein
VADSTGGKEFPLSIVIQAIDKATAPLREINAKISALTAPIAGLGAGLAGLGREAGLGKVADGFHGVTSAVGALGGKLLGIGAAGVGAGFAVKGVLDQFDDLGDTADRIRIPAEELASLRYAAERSGAEIGDLDSGVQSFARNLGMLSAGKGKLKKFLDVVAPDLEKDIKGKSLQEALPIFADAVSKLGDQEKKITLAGISGLGPKLVPMLDKGATGMKELTDRSKMLSGPLSDAVKAGGEFDDSMKDLDATLLGVKAVVAKELGPTFTAWAKDLGAWVKSHRGDIEAWLQRVSEWLPKAFARAKNAVLGFIAAVAPLWDAIGGLQGVAIGLGAALVGPVIMALGKFSVALLTTPAGWFLLAVSAIALAVYEIVDNWDYLGGFFSACWDEIKEIFVGFWQNWLWPFLHTWTPVGWIVDNWDGIANFFSTLWKGVVDAFEWAWSKIQPIIDAISRGVDRVQAAGRYVRDAVGLGGDQRVGEAAIGEALRAIDLSSAPQPGGGTTRTETVIKVDFANAPRGLRADVDSPEPGVALDVGYQWSMLP